MIDIATSKTVVEDTLRIFLDRKKEAALAIHPSYRQLLDEIDRVVFSGGKRLRPHLVFLGCGTYDETAATVAAAHELLHTALLAHDDIIDRDAVRHGQPTIHSAYNSAYRHVLADTSEREHFSESAALLAGDLLISFAYELLSKASLPEKQRTALVSLFSEGMFEVIGGELLDTEAAFVDEPADPLTIYRYKTASYSLISPLLSGAIMSSPAYDHASLDALRQFATSTGIAYQIKDDLLGVVGESNLTGKSTTSDLREGKRTFLIDTFISTAAPDRLALFDQTFGHADATDDDLALLQDVIRASDAVAATETAVHDHTRQALESLRYLNNPELADTLADLADLLITRKS